MKYRVTARNEWTEEHAKRFGASGKWHDLTDSEIVSIIMEFGRADITNTNEPEFRELEFHNGYD